MVCGMVKWKQWLGVKAGPWWRASVSVKMSKLGQLHVMMVWLEKPRRSGVADALHSANSNTRSSGFTYIPWCPYSALLRNYSASVAKGMFIFLGENIHFVKGHGVGKCVE